MDQAQARCFQEGADPELFAPVSETGPAMRAQIDQAKSYCDRCEGRTDCLDEALAAGDVDTIRGGYTPSERVELMRERLYLNLTVA
jgi:WhiB family redox-sensing transcriptional regulator